MVCHPLPPPLSPDLTVEDSVNHIGNNPVTYYPLRPFNFDDYSAYQQLTRFGFTPATVAMLHAPNVVDPTGVLHSMFIFRSVEEGWVILDICHNRWKRLGWLDWTDIYDVQYDSILLRVSQLAIVTDTLREMLERDDHWLWGLNGWRYEIPERLPDAQYRRLLNMCLEPVDVCRLP